MAAHVLGWIMHRLAESTGTPARLDEAVSLQQSALAQIPVSKRAYRPRLLHALGAHLIAQYRRTGDPRYIDEAEVIVSEAIEVCPPMHVHRCPILGTAINALCYKFHHAGAIANLDRAMDLGRRALATDTLPVGENRAAFLNALANVCSTYNEISPTHSEYNAKEVVELRRQVLEHISPDSMFRWLCMANLAASLSVLFLQNADMRLLEEAIRCYRLAVKTIPDGHPDVYILMSNLARTLGYRSEQTADSADLDEALDVGCRTLEMTIPPNQYAYAAHTVIVNLCSRFKVRREVDDLEKAIALAKESRKTVAGDSVKGDDVAYQQSEALLLRGRHTFNLEDVDEAIAVLTTVLPNREQSVYGPESLRHLVSCHLIKFRLGGDTADAQRALDITNTMMGRLVPSHYARFQCLLQADELYLECGTPFRSVPVALDHFAGALSDIHRDVRSRLQGAKYLLGILESQHRDVFSAASPIQLQLLDIYTTAVGLLPRVAFFGLHLHSRLLSLAIGQTIALDGASHALILSLPERALEILEQGRATFWTHNLRLRTPFDSIPQNLRSRIMPLVRQLERVSNTADYGRDPGFMEAESARRREQSEEFNSLVEQVRLLPGLERFLLHNEFSVLSKAADRGPVTVLVSSTLACHAIVIKSPSSLIHIPLESLTDSWLVESGKAWRLEVTKARAAARESRKMLKTVKARKLQRTQADDILQHLWIRVVQPVFNKLGLKVYSPSRSIMKG
jgi:tetratricopeptide (TPR) repeat protein